LLEKIYNNEFYLSKDQQKELFLQPELKRMQVLIQTRFKRYFSKERIDLIISLLDYRYKYIERIMQL